MQEFEFPPEAIYPPLEGTKDATEEDTWIPPVEEVCSYCGQTDHLAEIAADCPNSIGNMDVPGLFDEEEVEREFDMGPEVDDQGGMSEHRFLEEPEY